MPDYEIRIRLTGASEGWAQHIAWVVKQELWRKYPHLQGGVESPRLVNAPGSTVEQLPPEVLARIDRSDYLSTACETAFRMKRADLAQWADRLHDRCRRNHKFTGESCCCACHGEAGGGSG